MYFYWVLPSYKHYRQITHIEESLIMFLYHKHQTYQFIIVVLVFVTTKCQKSLLVMKKLYDGFFVIYISAVLYISVLYRMIQYSIGILQVGADWPINISKKFIWIQVSENILFSISCRFFFQEVNEILNEIWYIKTCV